MPSLIDEYDSAGNSSGTPSLPVDASAEAGDLLVFCGAADASITFGAAWTVVAHETAGTPEPILAVREIQAGEPGTNLSGEITGYGGSSYNGLQYGLLILRDAVVADSTTHYGGTAGSNETLAGLTADSDNSIDVIVKGNYGDTGGNFSSQCWQGVTGYTEVIAGGSGWNGFDSPYGRTIGVDILTGVSEGAQGTAEYGSTWAGTTSSGEVGAVRVMFSAANVAPNAPTGLSPDSTTIDRADARQFSWTFNDSDAGDMQSAYELRHRPVGSATWTTVSGGSNEYHDFAGGTFAAGDHEWQVRTTDNASETGPWSSVATFTAADTPATPELVTPADSGTINTETYSVSWTAAAQSAYRVRTVADAAGSPDTGTVYQDTGVVESTDRSVSIDFDTNGRDEHVQVQVRSDGLWSAWESHVVSVSYVAPPTPTISVSSSDATASNTVAITNPAPSGSEPVVQFNEVWVRVASGGRKDVDRPVGGDGVRLSVSTESGGSFTDHVPRPDTEYEYRVKALGDNGIGSWSVWASS